MASRPGFSFSMRVLGGTLGAEWDRERRDTLFLMGAILLAVLPQVPYLPAWCVAGFGLLFSWRLGLVFSGRSLPGSPIRLAAAAASTAGVLAEYDTLFGREAGVALLVLFLGLKLMEMRARRDLFVVIFLCFFLLLTGFFRSQSLPTALVSGLAAFALVASMLTMQFGQREVPVARRLRFATVLMLQALTESPMTVTASGTAPDGTALPVRSVEFRPRGDYPFGEQCGRFITAAVVLDAEGLRQQG